MHWKRSNDDDKDIAFHGINIILKFKGGNK